MRTRERILSQLTPDQRRAVTRARAMMMESLWDKSTGKCRTCIGICGVPCQKTRSREGPDYRDQSLLGVEWLATGLSIEEMCRIDPSIQGSRLAMLRMEVAARSRCS